MTSKKASMKITSKKGSQRRMKTEVSRENIELITELKVRPTSRSFNKFFKKTGRTNSGSQKHTTGDNSDESARARNIRKTISNMENKNKQANQNLYRNITLKKNKAVSPYMMRKMKKRINDVEFNEDEEIMYLQVTTNKEKPPDDFIFNTFRAGEEHFKLYKQVQI